MTHLSALLHRCIRYIVSTLPDEFLHALLLLSLFPGSFERRAAAELLGMTSIALSKTRSLLRILATSNLLQYSSTSERYIMHASVRACCTSLAQELGLTYESARYDSPTCAASHRRSVIDQLTLTARQLVCPALQNVCFSTHATTLSGLHFIV